MSTNSTSPQPAIAAQLAEINQGIAWHYSQISILKAKANALNSISALPNEIISKIFVDFAFLSGPPFDLKWTKVMLVCRRWHDIALAEQQLWGFIQDSYSCNWKRIRAQLKRSGAAPLTVKIMAGDSGMYNSTLLRHAERLRELRLTGSGIHVLGFMHSLAHRSLPLLREVKFDPSYKLEDVPAEVPRSFPDALFDGRAPRLTELDLTQIPVNWSLLRGLTRLSLVKASDTYQPDTFTKVLSLLESSPALTYLKLARLISSNALEQLRPPASLPVLESIWIQDDVELCTALLRHIKIPPPLASTGADIAPFLVPVRAHVRASGAPTLRCVQLNAGESNFMVSTFTVTTAPNVLEYDSGHFIVNTHPANEHALRGIMTKVLKALPCATITHLDCRSATHLAVSSWKTAIALLPALEMMYTFVNVGATRLFTALVELTENPRKAVYPLLRHIHLYALIWGDDDTDTAPSVLDALRLLLTTRQARGTPLPILEITDQGASLNLPEAEWEASEYEEFRRQWQEDHPDDPW
ncbi:hypothetical protein DFH08DRAFT_973393 [Mycena albidolilacea]|uniref:F-box domain-containing protein n=1 Tax=Mycena albidolilacea TaxID=1033008 RepID=A0AAD6Z9P7_9AGAR|nr:hypothetical protein DFH08DRAFT_973393 [Mycena albidolilacea]